MIIAVRVTYFVTVLAMVAASRMLKLKS